MFIRPTLTELKTRAIEDLRTQTVGQDGSNNSLARRAVLRVLAIISAGLTHLLYGFIAWVIKQMFITSADRTYLELQGAEFGVTVKYGTSASGACLVTGTATKVVPAGRELLNTVTGLKYTVDAAVTIPAGGTVSIDVTAKSVGEDYNEAINTVLKFVSPIIGVNTTVTVTTAIASGEDEETEEQYRARVLRRKRQPPSGGADFDYEAWALEVAGVTRSWSFPQYQGLGTVGVAFVKDNDTDIFPDAAEREVVRLYIVEHTDAATGETVGVPVGAVPGTIMIELTAQSINLAMDIYPNNGTVQSNIQSRLSDLFLAQGPGDTIRYSDLMSAISNAVGLEYFRLNTPADDLGISANRLPQLGVITYGVY